MNLKEMFADNSKKRSYLKNLVAIAKIENITREEFDFLVYIGEKVGVNKSEIIKMLDRTKNIKVNKPETTELAIDYIYDIILMCVGTEGKIYETEIDYTIEIALKLGLNPITAGIIVRRIFTLVGEKKTKQMIFQTLKNHLFF